VKLDDAVAKVARARKRLEDDQGRIARKNARAAVKTAVASVLRAMDREYPLIRKERVVRAAMTPLAKKRRERRRRMEYAMVVAADAARLAACGVRVTQPDPGGEWRVPRWAYEAMRGGVADREIRAAVHSQSVRRRIFALLRLRSP
jgi:hypothetical protein